MNIGNAIREIRLAKGISQGKFAEAIGISQSSLCQLEKNAKKPHPLTMAKICDELQVSSGAIYVLAMTEEDIAKDKIEIYNSLKPLLMLVTGITHNPKK